MFPPDDQICSTKNSTHCIKGAIIRCLEGIIWFGKLTRESAMRGTGLNKLREHIENTNSLF